MTSLDIRHFKKLRSNCQHRISKLLIKTVERQ